MQGPQDGIRARVSVRADHADAEEDVETALAEIEAEMMADLASDASLPAVDDLPAASDAAQSELVALNQWAALASYACARFYAPASPWPKSLAGWGQRVAARLQRIARALGARLQAVGRQLGVTSVSVSVNYPWGLSVSLNW